MKEFVKDFLKRVLPNHRYLYEQFSGFSVAKLKEGVKLQDFVADLLENYKLLRCNMSVKVHFSYIHLDYLPENLGSMSKEQGAPFDQEVKAIE